MTQSELNHLTTILTQKHAELVLESGRRDGIAIERTPDALDETQLAVERELTTRNLERGSRLLRNVKAALERVAEAAYGACMECEEEISQKRLCAVPWATRCITCQEQADRREQQRFSHHSLLDKAA